MPHTCTPPFQSPCITTEWFPALCSILLLCKDKTASAGATAAASSSASTPAPARAPASGKLNATRLYAAAAASNTSTSNSAASQAPGSASSSGRAQGEFSGGASAGSSEADPHVSELVEKLQAFRAGCNLDWSNSCVFTLHKARGPIVQTPPSWPLSCTAAFHAALVAADLVTTGDYGAAGPHFLDWKALAEKGCVSMAATPMFSCKRPVAVLCLASDQVRIARAPCIGVHVSRE